MAKRGSLSLESAHDLILRAEDAEPKDERPLLIEAYGLCFEEGVGPLRFFTMLDAGGPINAALLLLPKGWWWSVDGPDEDFASASAGPARNRMANFVVKAPTPALALMIVALRARLV